MDFLKKLDVMSDLLFVCVNYNSYKELSDYYDSIRVAAEYVNGIRVRLIIADNSLSPHPIDLPSEGSIDYEVRHFDNLGYLGAAQQVINSLDDITKYDYVAITNVDIKLKRDFFKQLEMLHFDNDVAWVAPQIWSEVEHRDRNPKIMQRNRRRKLKIQRILYKYPMLDWIYAKTVYKRKLYQDSVKEREIYAGHGSFILLTKSFFRLCHKLAYPVFLFGEEIYIAELIRNAGLRVRYLPNLVVYDAEHVSTGILKKSFYYKCNMEAIEYILKTFYNE